MKKLYSPGGITLSSVERILRGIVQRYNSPKYWKRRNIVIDPSSKLPRIVRLYYLLYLKRCEAFNNATSGIHMGFGAQFSSIPNLPHGLYGIVISHNVTVGENCTIYHQVTIGEGRGGAPKIGNNVVLGAGCKIIGGIHISDNAKIAAGVTVMQDVPENAVVLPPAPIIKLR